MTTQDIKDPQLIKLQKKRYMKIALCLWQGGATEANEEYPDISVEQFQTANKYYNSLRCEGCSCGACVNLPQLASNLDQSPKELEPIAQLAKGLGEADFNKG